MPSTMSRFTPCWGSLSANRRLQAFETIQHGSRRSQGALRTLFRNMRATEGDGTRRDTVTSSRGADARPAVEFESVLVAEVDRCIRRRRAAIGRADSVPQSIKHRVTEADSRALRLVGLALSGGGIRSAAYNLGLLQALGKYSVLREVDYLSTVSGGGYIGCCLTALLSSPGAGVDRASFPLRFDGANERDEIKRLRAHASYLAPRHGLLSSGTWRMVSAYLLGLLVNLTMVCLVVGVAATLLINAMATYVRVMRSGAAAPLVRALHIPLDSRGTGSEFDLLLIPVLVLAALWLMIGVYYMIRALGRWTIDERRRLVGLGGKILLATACGTVVALASRLFHMMATPSGGVQLPRVVLPGYLVGLGATALPLLRSRAILERAKSALAPFLLTIAAGLFMLLFLLGITFVAWQYKDQPLVLVGSIAAALVMGLFIDINRVSMFYFYRDRLSEAFIFRRESADGELVLDDGLLLARAGQAMDPTLESAKGSSARPYPLINATVNLPGSQAPELRGRAADFFLLSPLYCGSRVTGYVPTEMFERSRIGLATAMAISGAAANPQLGFKTNRALAFVMAVFDARLGVWCQNPKFVTAAGIGAARPRFWPFYLLLELWSAATEQHAHVNLSDGGHTDNLGVYELLRRRCSTIIVSDASADPGYGFEDLANVLRKARIDLGIQITLETRDLVPGASGAASSQHVVVGDIIYPGVSGPPDTGKLILTKPAVLASDPQDLREYQRAHPTFPHQATINQFFEEDQFESYRELGYQAGKELAKKASPSLGIPTC